MKHSSLLNNNGWSITTRWFIETDRGGRHLVWNGYTYRQNNNIETWISWKCTQRNCKATICTREDWTTTKSSTWSSRSGGKAHTQHHTKKSRNELTPLPSIYDEEITKPRDAPWDAQNREVASKLPTLHTVKSSLYRSKQKMLPSVPTTRPEVHWRWYFARLLVESLSYRLKMETSTRFHLFNFWEYPSPV